MKVAIIGCGEVGYIYARAISNAGYNLQLCTPRPSATLVSLSNDNNIPLHTTIDKWIADTDVVMLCTPATASLAVAKEVFSFLRSGAMLADFSSASAACKQEAASLAATKGFEYTDAVIMGSVALHQEKTPLLCAGTGAHIIVTMMNQFGTPVRVLKDAKAGSAATLKLLRTIFTKGLAALTVECVVAAQRFGVKDLLYEMLSDIDKTPLNEYLDMLLRNHVQHACRQRHEIADAINQMQSTGMLTQVLPAVELLFATTCEAINANGQVNQTIHNTEEALNWLVSTRLVQE